MNPFRSAPRASGLSAMAVLLAAGCSLDPWSGREGVIVNNIQVDSLRILPYGSRYVLRDSAASIRFQDFRTGYAVGRDCARILEMRVDSVPAGIPPAYRPVTRLQMPGNPEVCAVDSGGQDDTISHVFRDGSRVRLANSAGAITDSALLVSGSLLLDSIKGIPGVAGTFSVGGLTFRDSSSLAPRLLHTDTVDGCKRFNQAEYRKGDKFGKGDTVTVRYSWVTLASAADGATCGGPVAEDSIPVPRERR
jgi:hypothetical protein